MAEHSKPVRLAAAALHAGIDGKWAAASCYIQRINDECGPDSLPYALMGWVDTALDHATDGHPVTGVGQVRGMEYETGRITDSPPPRVQWAQRVMKARADLDEAAFTALIDDLHQLSDGHEVGSYVGAVCEAAALTIRGLPRGYAVMGRPS